MGALIFQFGGEKEQPMNRYRSIAAMGLIGLGLLVAGCGGSSSGSEPTPAAVVEEIEGTDTSRIILTEKAAQRLQIKTAAVQAGEGTQTVIPYSAVAYEPNGDTFAYVNPEPLTFVRHPIVVDRVDGDSAILTEGPKPGAMVATVGVAELFGTEIGIGQ
jgi:multidrug efflux pump subunit AcrA (membrane-fusion protein)